MTAVLEVWKAFGKLGISAFGGPVAHIGFFRQEFVIRRGWLTEAQFSQLVVICQFLPGPASSQLGFAIGLLRAGWQGALAAFIAFTLPSALLLFTVAGLSSHLDNAAGSAIIHGLKLVAVAVVSHAVWGMSQSLTPDWPRRGIALGALLLLLLPIAHVWMPLLVIALGALLGLFACHNGSQQLDAPVKPCYSRKTALVMGSVYLSLLLLSLFLSGERSDAIALFAGFYQAGALVFGGGHVVLPLLEQTTVAQGWLSADSFLAGYGAAQAVPGPLFTFASYLGAEIDTPLAPGWSALIATLAIFLPGFLLLLALLPVWSHVQRLPGAAAAISGVNAAVVGLLAAALYTPVITSGVQDWSDVLIALGGFAIIAVLKKSALWTVLFCVLATFLLHLVNG